MSHPPRTGNTAFFVTTCWILFLEGLYYFNLLAIDYYYKNNLDAHPSTLSAIVAISYLPFSFGPVYGIMIDTIPIFGYYRKSYIILSGLAGSAAWICMGLFEPDVWLGCFLQVVGSASLALADVVAQAMVVEESRGQPQEYASHLQSIIWGANALGAVIAAVSSGWILDYVTPEQTFLITALLPLTFIPCGIFAPDFRAEEEQKQEQMRINLLVDCGVDPTSLPADEVRKASFVEIIVTQCKILITTLRMPQMLYPLCFIALYSATPVTGSAWFYFYSTPEPEGLGFSAFFLGIIATVGSCANLAAVVIFQAFLKNTSFKPVLIYATTISAAVGLSQLLLVFHINRQMGIPDKFMCLGESTVNSIATWVSTMPIVVLSARMCPVGLEGTMSSVIASIINLASIVGLHFGAVLMESLTITSDDMSNFWILVLVCNLSSLLPLMFVRFLPDYEDIVFDETPTAQTVAEKQIIRELTTRQSMDGNEDTHYYMRTNTEDDYGDSYHGTDDDADRALLISDGDKSGKRWS